MRRKIISTLIAVLLACSPAITAFAESAVVTGSRVNIRSGPGTNYPVQTTVEKGTVVEVTDRSNGTWYLISNNGIPGFISSSYLQLTGNTAGASIAVAQTPTSDASFYINAMYVRFRSGPGSNYSIVGEYNKGKEIKVVTTVGDWVAGYIDGNPGYVHKQYVTKGVYTAPTPTAGTQGGISVITPDVGGDIGWLLPDPEPGGVSVVSPVVTPQLTQTGNIQVMTEPAVPTEQPVQQTPFTINIQPNIPYVITPPPATSTPLTVSVSTPAPAVVPSPAAVNANGVKGIIVGTYVRLRSGPGTNYSIINSYNTGKETIVYANCNNGWLFCSVDGKEGYISGNYVYINSSAVSDAATAQTQTSPVTVVPVATQPPAPTQNTAAYIIGNNVRFRSAPSMTSQIIAELFYGNPCTILGTQDEWTMIQCKEKTGYVYSQYVKEGTYGAVEPVTTQPSVVGKVTGADIVNLAMSQLGANYCWGGVSPTTGFDCSGLVYYVYSQFGYTLNRVAADQAKNGVHVDPANLQPGDILCFYSGSSYIGHSGIYIGNNRFIHSSNSTTGVIISDLAGYYVTRGFEARRIV